MKATLESRTGFDNRAGSSMGARFGILFTHMTAWPLLVQAVLGNIYLLLARQRRMYELAVQQACPPRVRRQEPHYKGHLDLVVEGKPGQQVT